MVIFRAIGQEQRLMMQSSHLINMDFDGLKGRNY